MSLLVSFLYLLLHIAVIVCVAFVIRWLIVGLFKIAIDPDVEKWARIIIVLLIVIAIVLWVLGITGYGPGLQELWLWRR